MAMTTTSKGKLLATVFALVAIGLIIFTMVRGKPIDKRDLGDLYGCYVIDDQQLFRLTPDAFVTPTRSVAFTAHQGRRYAYLDLASPMRVVHRGGALSFEPGPEPVVTIEVYRGTPRALLLRSDAGPPIEAIRTECRP